MKIEFTKAAGPFLTQDVIVNGTVVGQIRKAGRFYVLRAKDGSTFKTEGMQYAYAKTFTYRSDAQEHAREHWRV